MQAIEAGKTYLITTDGWFFAPDGEQYRSAFGTVEAVLGAEESLGIKTNRGSTNWYVKIGNLLIAGCQIHYALRTDKVSYEPPSKQIQDGSRFVNVKHFITNIYNADQ